MRHGRGWALVTGASSGIGLEFARELARRGHPVVAVARRAERLAALAKLASAGGGRVEPLTADLTTEEGLSCVRRRIQELGHIELLINNAGIAIGEDFAGSSLDEAAQVVRVNVEALLRLTHAVLPAMVQRGHGGLINMASVVAFQALPHFAVYAATKAWVLSFTEALAEELRGSGVRVLALCPGSVETEMELFAHNQGLLGKLPSLTAAEVVKTGLQALASGRVVRVVGTLNRFLPLMNRLMPRAAMRRLMGASVRV
jgi:short-subunit dehydrogenase